MAIVAYANTAIEASREKVVFDVMQHVVTAGKGAVVFVERQTMTVGSSLSRCHA